MTQCWYIVNLCVTLRFHFCRCSGESYFRRFALWVDLHEQSGFTSSYTFSLTTMETTHEKSHNFPLFF